MFWEITPNALIQFLCDGDGDDGDDGDGDGDDDTTPKQENRVDCVPIASFVSGNESSTLIRSKRSLRSSGNCSMACLHTIRGSAPSRKGLPRAFFGGGGDSESCGNVCLVSGNCIVSIALSCFGIYSI